MVSTYTAAEAANKLADLNRAYTAYGAAVVNTPSSATTLNALSDEFEALSRWFEARNIRLDLIQYGSGQGFKVKE
jgi:hypothetical protein